VKPYGVVIPRSQEGLEQAVSILSSEVLTMIPRGAATGITGGCLGEGVIIDTSKYLNRILDIKPEQSRVVCEPGVIQDDLNLALSPYQLRLGPDTSTGNRATLGGMAANCAAGARSLLFGTMVNAVEEVDLILGCGEKIHLGPVNAGEWQHKLTLHGQEGDIYRGVEYIRTHYSEAIRTSFPSLPRRSSGYPLDELLKPFPLNLAKLIVGSEGSLGIISTLTLSVVPTVKHLEMCLAGFDSMQQAMRAVPFLLKENPIALEMVDDKILKAGCSAPSLRGKLDWLHTIPSVLLIAEFQDNKSRILAEQVHKLDGVLFTQAVDSLDLMEDIWSVRKAGLGLLLSKRTFSRAIAFIEDLSIPPQKLTEFMDWFLNYLKSQGKEAGIYGHVGSGCVHIRPYLDLRSPEEVKLMQKMMLDVAKKIREVGGAMSGEHGDGLIRSWLNETLFGKDVIDAFQRLKQTFDPLGLMNPHKVVDPLPVDRSIRKSPQDAPKTFLSFAQEGGVILAADLCNGNGECRKRTGVMCPSYQVTHDEYDTTRARAQAMREVMRGKNLSDPDLHAILDLCIQCKGCKTECPSQVDMAKLKSETLFHYQEKNGYSLRNRLFAYIDRLTPRIYPLRSIYNAFISSSFGKKLLSWSGVGGPLPHLAEERFSIRAKKIKQPDATPVVLLSDTYTEFFCPEVGLAAIQVLNRLGYHVTVPEWKCCGRAAISKGFLPHAQDLTRELIRQIKPYIDQYIPIIGLEPSCLYTLWDELPALLPQQPALKQCQLFDSFVLRHAPILFTPPSPAVAVHGHCHQKAIQGMQDTLALLHSFPDLHIMEIPSGCCGMAGSFGHETEHLDFSRQIGELILLPFVRSLPVDTLVIANGFSCRTQIRHHTQRKALHLAEWLANSYPR
jgi:FAD/FMN-containing dehydrogenase/Fe-S oxidoreductase